MDTEERVKALEDEFQATKDELRQILLDIRTVLMEAQTPLPTDFNRGNLSGQGNSEKGVDSNGHQ